MKKFAAIICDKGEGIKADPGDLLILSFQDDGTAIIGRIPKEALATHSKEELEELCSRYIKRYRAKLMSKEVVSQRGQIMRDIIILSSDSLGEIISEMIDVVSARAL